MQQIFGYLGGHDAYTQLNQFSKKTAQNNKSEKSVLQTSEFQVSESHHNLNNSLLGRKIKLNKVNSGLVFQKGLKIEKISQQIIKPHIATIGELALVFKGEINDEQGLKSDLTI